MLSITVKLVASFKYKFAHGSQKAPEFESTILCLKGKLIYYCDFLVIIFVIPGNKSQNEQWQNIGVVSSSCNKLLKQLENSLLYPPLIIER